MPCLSYRDKFDLLYVLAGSQFDQELHKVFINKVVSLLKAGKILRFCKNTKIVDYSKYNDAYGAFGSYENVIWFFDSTILVRELGVIPTECKLLKCLTNKIFYFTVFTNFINFKPEDKMYNFTDFTNDNSVKEVLDNVIIDNDLLLKIHNLKFDLSPKALFK